MSFLDMVSFLNIWDFAAGISQESVELFLILRFFVYGAIIRLI